ncbi:MAG: hypothetical protein OXI96_10545 [Acidimicrobiaceae bacterium]|nr:hypothetical protein [Acidimicrobiaceae bacterium]
MSTVKAVTALLTSVVALSLVPFVIKLVIPDNNTADDCIEVAVDSDLSGDSDVCIEVAVDSDLSGDSDGNDSDNADNDNNPFTFAAVQTLAQIIVLGIYLRVTAPRRFGTTKLREIIGEPKNLIASSYKPKLHKTSTFWRIYDWFAVCGHTPLLWAVIVGLEYSLLSWSALYIEVAVSSIIYGVWPLVMIYALIYLSRETEGARNYHIFFQKKVLTAVAVVGIAFVAYGQVSVDEPLFSETVMLSIAGMFIAFIAALLNAMNPAMTIHFSDLLYQITPCRKSQDRIVIARQKLWLSICAVTAGRILSLPLNLTIGFLFFGGDLRITRNALLAGLAVGIFLLPTASILLRLANLNISDLSINALCYFEPVLTFTWIILFTTIKVPRFDLFIVGAGIIAATNILMQIVPDIDLGTRPSTGRKNSKK